MKQLKKQGRYIILKRRICAFKVRADFENKRKTDGIYLMILTHFFLLNTCEGEKNLDKKMSRSI